MGGISFDPDQFGLTPNRRKKSASSSAEMDQWLETLESLLADVADDPEVAAPLARLIARNKDRQEAAAERTKRTLSSLDSLLLDARRSDSDRAAPLGYDTEAALLDLEAAMRRHDPDSDPADS